MKEEHMMEDHAREYMPKPKKPKDKKDDNPNPQQAPSYLPGEQHGRRMMPKM